MELRPQVKRAEAKALSDREQAPCVLPTSRKQRYSLGLRKQGGTELEVRRFGGRG